MWNDLRFAMRSLRRSAGFTFIAVASLALGIGANTAIFSLLYQVALRSLPVKDPGALVSLESDQYTYGRARRDNNQGIFSYPMYRELRDRNQAFTGLAARAGFPATLGWRGDASRVAAEVVSGNFFQVMGIQPALGRALMPSDDAAGSDTVIVLGYSYWENHFGGDRAILNTRILLNGHPALIVGVGPRNFRGIRAGQTPDLYAPIAMTTLISPDWRYVDQPDGWWLNLIGRLRPGASALQASAALRPLFHAILENEIPQMDAVSDVARQKILAKTITAVPASRGFNGLRDEWETPLLVLTVMVGLVLLMACVNLANLLIARATMRRREIAVRLAVGASRWRIARQVLVESLLLSISGGGVGVFLSQNLTQGLLSLLPADESGGWLTAQTDFRLIGFGLALSLLTGLCFGLIPALQAARRDVAPVLKEQSTSASATAGQSRTRQALVVAQVCLSLLLLIGAGLFSRSLANLMSTDPGFRADHLITFTVDPSLSGYSHERSMALFRGLEDRLRAMPGVSSVARAALPPFGGWNWGGAVKAPGSTRAGDEFVSVGQNAIAPGYFRTMRIPLIAGREFTAGDSQAAPKVAIVNETLAGFLFGNENPVGRHMIMGARDSDVQIVGVVKDSKFIDMREKAAKFAYIPFEQAEAGFVSQAAFFIRAGGDERTVIAAIPATVKQLDADLPVVRLAAMKTMIDDMIYTDRLIATLAVAFGILSTILAAVGLYGTVSYSVTRRTREFGIRLVAGATPRSLLLDLMREVARLVAIGIALGLPAAYVLSRLVEAQFYGINAHDPLVLLFATLSMAAVAFSAALIPAIRAMRIEPIRALRYE